MKKLLVFVLFLQFAVVAGYGWDPEPRCWPCPPVTEAR